MGTRRQRVQEQYDGLPILGTLVEVELSSDATLLSVHSDNTAASEIEKDVPDTGACARTEDELIQVGKIHFCLVSDYWHTATVNCLVQSG